MRIFVGNLHVNASEGMLHDLFAVYGDVSSVTIATNSSGSPQGHGYVEMKEPDARRAIKQLNKINFMNQFLNIYGTGHP
jgi:RNA recognition motif-containing protein